MALTLRSKCVEGRCPSGCCMKGHGQKFVGSERRSEIWTLVLKCSQACFVVLRGAWALGHLRLATLARFRQLAASWRQVLRCKHATARTALMG